MAVSVEEMIKNAVHFGHRKNKWNPRMKPFIYGQVNGIHLFDLKKTKEKFDALLAYVKKAVQEDKTILFVSTKPQTMELIPRLAAHHNSPYVTQKWFGGLLTNFETMKERMRYFKNLKEQQATGEFEKFTKKESNKMEKEIVKLGTALGGIESMRRLPGVIFVVDGKRDLIAIKEAKKLGIPVVGFCDSNANPADYDLFVPANDDAMKSLNYLLGEVEEVLKTVKPVMKQGPKPAQKPVAEKKNHLNIKPQAKETPKEEKAEGGEAVAK